MSKIEVNQISSQCGSTLTIGQSGDTVTLACGATQTGFGRTGTVDWDTTAKTAGFTAVSGVGYFVNTTSGAITVTLPAGSAGSIVSLKDYANTWQTNNVTVTPNGSDKINGTNDSAVLTTEDQSVTLVYVDSTKGWRVVQDSTSDVTGAEFIVATGGTETTCGDYKIHTFTGPGTFTVCSVGNPAGSTTVDYLVVAGGGGAACRAGGGGGAGGLRASATTYAIGCNPAGPLVACVSALPVTATGYPVTVGSGGSAGCNQSGNQTSGSNSVFSTITSAGGGKGANFTPSAPSTNAGSPGGSGGGGGGYPGPSHEFGLGNTPPVSPPQGNNGGDGDDSSTRYNGGGGGGAIAAGSPGPNPGVFGDGGAGAGFNCGVWGPGVGEISSCVAYFAGGGGGGALNNPIYPDRGFGTGGLGGGGDGRFCNSSPDVGESGTANTGGGGGAAGKTPGTGGAGGSGIVVIRYKYQ